MNKQTRACGEMFSFFRRLFFHRGIYTVHGTIGMGSKSMEPLIFFRGPFSLSHATIGAEPERSVSYVLS